MRILIAILLILSTTLAFPTSINPGAVLVGSGEPATLIKGPTNRASVKGPSGPIIVTSGDTGAISSSRKLGGVVSAAPQSAGVIAAEHPLAPVAVASEPYYEDYYEPNGY